MSRVVFVTGSACGVGVGNLQHGCALRKSNGGSRDVLNLSLMRSVTMLPPNDDLHNVLLAKRPDAIPDENNITVQGILEKSWSADSVELWRLPTRSANHPDIFLRCGHIKGGQENRNHKALSHTGILISSRYWSA
jgi:hypothetical protein